MAIHTVYDLESTGFSTQTANILTFSYASFNGRDIFEPVDSGTLFFFKKGWEIPKEASEVNGLTEEIMLPHVADFRVNCRKMWKIMQKANVVGQNIKSYDNNLLRSFFKRQGYDEITFHRVMDCRYGLGSSRSLDDLISELDIDEENIINFWSIIFPNSPFSEELIRHHNGEYDVVATTLIWLKLCGRNAKGFTEVV